MLNRHLVVADDHSHPDYVGQDTFYGFLAESCSATRISLTSTTPIMGGQFPR